ncbi:hypothetical protein CLOM_g13223 [Closterium sp. NIES-68]|nr:hypothetical protein CLOM_g13223 [Closterium sp. NIES-68]
MAAQLSGNGADARGDSGGGAGATVARGEGGTAPVLSRHSAVDWVALVLWMGWMHILLFLLLLIALTFPHPLALALLLLLATLSVTPVDVEGPVAKAYRRFIYPVVLRHFPVRVLFRDQSAITFGKPYGGVRPQPLWLHPPGAGAGGPRGALLRLRPDHCVPLVEAGGGMVPGGGAAHGVCSDPLLGHVGVAHPPAHAHDHRVRHAHRRRGPRPQPLRRKGGGGACGVRECVGAPLPRLQGPGRLPSHAPRHHVTGWHHVEISGGGL